MPVYDIEHPTTGQKIRMEGAGVPTDADIREAFNAVSKTSATASPRSAELGKGAKMTPAEASTYAADRAAFAQEGGVPTFGGKQGGDTRKTSYTDSGYRPNKPAQSARELLRNTVQDVVELPLAPVRMLSDVANSSDTGSTLAELGKGLVRGPLEFVPGVGEALGGRSATEAWSTNPGMGALTLAGAGMATKGAMKGGRALREVTRPEPTELQTLSQKHNVPLTAGEELNSPNMMQVEARLERLPALGIRGFRKGQGESLAQSAKGLADEFATLTEDPATAIVDRFKSNLKKGKEESSQAYGKIGEALATNGDAGAIEMVSARSQGRALFAKSPDIFDRLPGDQSHVKGLIGKIMGQTKGTYDVGRTLENSPQRGRLLTYDEYTDLRGRLGEYIDRAYGSAGAVGSNELRQLTIFKKALDNDFYQWGKTNGYDNVTAAVDNARTVYKTKVAPFDNIPVLKSIVNDKFTPEQVLDAIAKPGQATLATRALRGMRDGDKALVQDAIMRRAMALSTEGAANGAPISGAKFATFFEKMDTRSKNAAHSPMDVFFSPEQKQLVMGFAKLARAAERSGQYAANPLTGVAAADFAIPGAIGGAAATVGAPAALTAAAFTKGMSLMLTTAKGKAILRRAYRTPAGSKAAWSSILSQSQQVKK